MSKVSVIIPVYNVERYLSACLDSVLGQTHKDLEVICIDDCSPDRCGEILDAYAKRDQRVKTVHLPENRRQGYGRNLGLSMADGKYVYFLDSDDMIEPETLSELTVLSDRDSLDAVFFDSRNIFEQEDLKEIYMPPLPRTGVYKDEIYKGTDLLDDFMRQNEWTCYPQRIFWRREFLLEEEIRYPAGSEHEDEYFAFAGILAAERVRYIRKPYFILRTRPDSVMTSAPAAKNFHGYLMNYWYMNRFLAERGISTYGAEKNVTRMFERVMTLHAALKDKCDLSAPFVRDLDRTVYRVFRRYIRMETGEDGYYEIDKEVLDVIRQYRIVYIYGARLTGQRFLKKLEHNGFLVGGFLIKEREEQPEILMGRKVELLDDVVLPPGSVVVAAVKVMYWEETRAMLEERGIPCVFHRRP